MRHGGELRIEQHDLRYLRGGLTAGGHCDATVGILEREHVVHAVARHGNGVTLRLEGTHELALLFRRDASEDGVLPHSLGKVAVGDKGRGVDVTVGVFDAGTGRDLRDGQRIVAGNDADGDAMLRKIAEGGGRVRADEVGQVDKGDRSCRSSWA